jgi:hypothetical protein
MKKLFTATELKERIKNNDNRATAMPYLLLLQTKERYIAHDEYDSGNVKDIWVEHFTGDYLWSESRDALIALLKTLETDTEEIIKSIQHHREGCFWRTDNVFLTDEGYKDHKTVNGHNLSEHRTYGIHAYRNKEIESLFNLIDENIKQQQRIEDLENFLKDMELCSHCASNETCDCNRHNFIGRILNKEGEK